MLQYYQSIFSNGLPATHSARSLTTRHGINAQKFCRGLRLQGHPLTTGRSIYQLIIPTILWEIQAQWELQPLTSERVKLWAAFTTFFFGFMTVY